MDNDEIAKRLEQVAMQAQKAEVVAQKAILQIEGHEKRCDDRMADIRRTYGNIEKQLGEGKENFKKIADDITDFKVTLGRYATAIVVIVAGVEFYIKLAA